jgi:hypothetical protein
MTPDFPGLPARSLVNDHLRVDYLLDAGPRLVRLILAGSTDNLLAEVPDMHWPTPWGEYHLRGGHRLAIAPEALELSYVPDGSDLVIEDVPGGVRLIRPTEIGSGVSKSIEIQLQPKRPALTLRQAVRNDRSAPIELAAWSITQLALGGVAVAPLRTTSAANRHLIELESLAPLAVLEPGQSSVHVETWEIYQEVDVPQSSEGLGQLIRSIPL